MRVVRSNNRKGGDVRDKVTRLKLEAFTDDERVFLAELGEAILAGTDITIGDKVWERVRIKQGGAEAAADKPCSDDYGYCEAHGHH